MMGTVTAAPRMNVRRENALPERLVIGLPPCWLVLFIGNFEPNKGDLRFGGDCR